MLGTLGSVALLTAFVAEAHALKAFFVREDHAVGDAVEAPQPTHPDLYELQRIDSEAIVAENGVIHVIDRVLVRPLITTTERYESAHGSTQATEGGFSYYRHYKIKTKT